MFILGSSPVKGARCARVACTSHAMALRATLDCDLASSPRTWASFPLARFRRE